MEKDRDVRYQHASDIRADLKRLKRDTNSRRSVAPGLSPSHADVAAGLPCHGGVRPPLQSAGYRALPWAVAGVLLGATLFFAFVYLRPTSQPAQAVRSSLLPPENSVFDPAGGPAMISPDGTQLAFVARATSGQDVLWVRPLDAPTAQPLAGTAGAANPLWSPDSRFLGFFAHRKVKKIAVSGGPAEAMADSKEPWGGSWGRDGVIIFAPHIVGGIYRVSASGGPAVPVTKVDTSRGETSHRWPEFLPDGRRFLLFVVGNTLENSGVYVGSLDGGTLKPALHGAADARYAAPGYLLFVREQTLMAQPFDARGQELSGEPLPVAEGVGADRNLGRGDFSVSGTGALVYHPSSWQGAGADLLLFDRAGKPIRSLGQGLYSQPAFSPEGRRLALQIVDPSTGTHSIWVYDLERNLQTRLTFNTVLDVQPNWSGDGSKVIFMSNRKGNFGLYEVPANGGGTSQPLVENSAGNRSPAASPDGRYLAYASIPPGAANFGIWILPLFGDRKPYALGQDAFLERFPRFSPDGRWLAYSSNESGREEVYAIPFPNGNGKWQISTHGGRQAKWRIDGRELYFLSPDNEMMAVDINERGSVPEIGTPHALFQAHPAPAIGSLYDVSADGKEFVVPSLAPNAPANAAPATLILNWPALLKNK